MPWINDDPDCDHCVPVGRTACYYDGHVTTGGRGPFLRIPTPSVLLAMEEVIAGARHLDAINADRAHRLAQDFCLTTIEEIPFSCALDRLRLSIDALARAEAEAKEAR